MDILRLADNFSLKASASIDPGLEQLSKIPSFAGRARFCEQNFKRITSGSGRIIFEYDPNHVIKLARNDKGIAQNATESDGFIQSNYSNIVARVLDSDPDDKWLLAERATTISPSQFKLKMGFSLDELYRYLVDRFDPQRYKIMFREDMPKDLEEKIANHPLVEELIDMMANFGMQPGDFGRKNSWGTVGDRLVLVDYGLTEDIYHEHYVK
jgi:hypothetical protein